MARQRILKPDFFTDEDLASCSPLARLLFAGLWTLADRRGRLRDQPQVIGGAIFPFAEALSVDGLIEELAKGGFVIRYRVGDKRFLAVSNFEKHQNPHPKEIESVIPAPPAAFIRGSAVKHPGLAAKGNGPALRNTESFPSVPSESVGRTESVAGPEPPTLPPADRAERAIRLSTDALRTKLYTLITAMAEADPEHADPTELMRMVTAYDKPDGSRVKGVVNASLLTHERLEKSIADAEAQLAEWRSASGTATARNA